jgi:hypothetical protein
MNDMKTSAKSKLKIYSITVIFLILCTALVVNLNNLRSSKTVNISHLYIEDVKNPDWLLKNSSLVVVANFIEKEPAAKGINRHDNSETIYVNNKIKIKKIIKNTSNDRFNVGDTTVIRTLGGKTDKLKVNTDTTDIVPEQGDILLFLVNSSDLIDMPIKVGETSYSVNGGPYGIFNLTPDGQAKHINTNDTFGFDEWLKKSK